MTSEELIEYIQWAIDELVASISRLTCETEEGRKVADTIKRNVHDLKNLITANESDA